MQGVRLEGLVEYFPEWQEDASCKAERPEVFQRLISLDTEVNIKIGEAKREYAELHAIGAEICSHCIVSDICGEYGKEHRLRGMYNGVTTKDRLKIRRHRARI